MMISRFCRQLCLAVLAACLAAVPACGLISSPPGSRNTSSPGPPRADARARDRVPVVAHVWHRGMPQLGVDVYWTANTRDSDAVVRDKARRIINYAVSLNANAVALSFPFYTYGLNSDTLYARRTTPSPARVAIFLTEAARSHIRVTLRPILNEAALLAQDPLAWRGTIEPADRSAWFRSYRRLLLPYAAVAASGQAATFVAGTELNSMEQDPRWPVLIHALRSVYPGELVYDENVDEFENHNTDLPLPAFGVDAYPRFQLPDSATVAQLAAAWESWLGAHSLAVRRRVVLSEVGIGAVAGAYQSPGAWVGTVDAPIVPQVQENWYQAVCRAAQAERLGGIYWWEVNFDADPAHPGPFQSDRITFLGRPAQKEIQACFAEMTPTRDGG